ncbi:MAG: hypothetical protein FWG29_10735 [Treponema sp.]|nr:hypothetical protein [Treponema sp.]
MAEVQTLPDYPRGITFEHVWASLMEDRDQLKELRESQKETAQIVKEVVEGIKETKLVLKEQGESVDKRIGALTNLFGDVTEAMVAPKICEKFEEFGFIFPRANPNVRFNDRVNNISFEVDILLENGDRAMLLEVKTKLTAERVNKNIEKLEKMRTYADLHGDKRIFLGAVAGIVVTDDVKNYALNQGLYFLEYSGENFYITPPNGKPKEW